MANQITSRNVERLIADFKADHGIELLSKEEAFLDELVSLAVGGFKTAEEIEEIEELEEKVRELVSVLDEINDLTGRY